MIRDGLKILILVLLLPGVVMAREKPGPATSGHKIIDTYLQTSGTISYNYFDRNTSGKDYEILMKYFEKRKNKVRNQDDLVKIIHKKIQEVFLHEYSQYSGFTQLFTSRTFDCVTATALYVSYLSELEIDFEIWETNYHTYLKIPSERNGMILIETTDPMNGFVSGNEAIEKEKQYLEDNLEGCLYENGLNIHKTTTPEEFTGLLYFNQAIKSFNTENYLDAMRQIQSAEMYYPSERIALLRALIMDKVSLVATSSI